MTNIVAMNDELCIVMTARLRPSKPDVGLMLGQRRRRWLNIEPTLGECLVLLV